MVHESPYLFTVNESEQPSQKLIRVVGSLVNASRGELDPVQNIIDPELLDNIRHSRSDVSFSFRYEGYDVTAHSDGRIVLRDPASIYAQLDNLSNTLHMSSGDEDKICADLLQQYPFDHENVLNVVYGQHPDHSIEPILQHGTKPPANNKVISVTSEGSEPDSQLFNVKTDLVDMNMEDGFSRLGKEILQAIGDWTSNPYKTVLCFRSIEAVIDRTDIETGFKFFHLLTEKISSSNVTAHYHINSKTCDEMTINALTPLFDAVVYEDGNFTISK
ncbi:hypothetical protein CP556_14785 [Natrinema sp. CBA1119]|uniref:DUF7504 family protein n=1 Tax=Natrinema sp. CBA1119 TaxID=1608465 RepID=UPI000BF7C2FE|nr:HalOD1 output domain-containing protein [Natrinema sp. CBA1119]PGF17241.1 hypothetical protein CP556_14785 [Natrinema sp. CBA1119]